MLPKVEIEWYMLGLPDDMEFQIRQSQPLTLHDAMEVAQNYENTILSLRRSQRKNELEEKKKDKKKGRKKRSKADSENSNSSSESKSSSSDPESSDSEPDRSRRNESRSRKSKDDSGKMVVKVKKESDSENKKVLKDLRESLDAIRVHLAEDKKTRKVTPTRRANVWWTRCGEPGHHSGECSNHLQRRVHYIDPHDGVYYTFPEEEPEPESYPIFQVQPVYKRGKAPQHLIRANPVHQPALPGPSQGMMPYQQFHVTCYNCGGPGHYANNCPYPKQGQGAPLPLPCQNYGEYGHALPNCPKPSIA